MNTATHRLCSAVAFPLFAASLAAQLAPPPPVSPGSAVVAAVNVTTAGVSGATSGVVAVAAPTAPPVVTPPVLPPIGRAEPPLTRGETHITLDVGFGIRAVPAARVTVPPGETLRITAPNLGDGFTYIWTKDGRAIAGTSGASLVFNSVSPSDAGTYACLFSTPTTLPAPSQSLVLGVGPTNRLLNLSARAVVNSGGEPGLVSGFVVAAGAQTKKLILRAIGPSLAAFGVSNPLPRPVLRVFDAAGRAYENGYVYPAVIGGPTYESDLAESLAKVGAFPLASGTRDVVLMMPFNSGSYTAQVSSADSASGTVLLEIYEVP